MEAAAYDPADDEREDPYFRRRAEQGVAGQVEASFLRFGFRLERITRRLKRATESVWDDYFGDYNTEVFESSDDTSSYRRRKPSFSGYFRCLGDADSGSLHRQGIFSSSVDSGNWTG